jgi:hypothetical protein
MIKTNAVSQPKVPFNPGKSLFISALLTIVVFFGLCGALLSRIMDVPKFHYVPLAVAIIVVALLAIQRKYLALYICGGILALIGILTIPDQIGILSYFSSIVLPFIWFCTGRFVDLTKVALGFFYISILLLFGLFLELSGTLPDLFPIIGVMIGEDVGQRYGSFTLNPLALGYFAATGGILSFALKNRIYVYISLVICLALLFFANSRGGIITFLASIIIFWFFRAASVRPRKNSIYRNMFLLAIWLILLAATLSNERVRSTFDWSGDEGNLGRLNQWEYCITQAIENPLVGIGAGRMTPIGVGDNPYIEEGIVKSCDSTLLKMSVEYGFFIAGIYFIILVGLLVYIGRKMHRKVADIPLTDQTRSIILAGSIAFSIFLQQFFNQTLDSVWIGAVFFSMSGYAYWRLRPLSHII